MQDAGGTVRSWTGEARLMGIELPARRFGDLAALDGVDHVEVGGKYAPWRRQAVCVVLGKTYSTRSVAAAASSLPKPHPLSNGLMPVGDLAAAITILRIWVAVSLGCFSSIRATIRPIDRSD